MRSIYVSGAYKHFFCIKRFLLKKKILLKIKSQPLDMNLFLFFLIKCLYIAETYFKFCHFIICCESQKKTLDWRFQGCVSRIHSCIRCFQKSMNKNPICIRCTKFALFHDLTMHFTSIYFLINS